MKNILITSTLLAMLATPSLALELGKGFGFDNDVKTLYNFTTEEFTATDKVQLNYHINDGLKVYLDTPIDLRDVHYNGSNLGVEYVPAAFDKITINAEARFDEDLKYTDTVVYAELKF